MLTYSKSQILNQTALSSLSGQKIIKGHKNRTILVTGCMKVGSPDPDFHSCFTIPSP